MIGSNKHRTFTQGTAVDMKPKLTSEWHDCSYLNPNHDVYLKLTTQRAVLAIDTSNLLGGRMCWSMSSETNSTESESDQPVCRTGCKMATLWTFLVVILTTAHYFIVDRREASSHFTSILSRPYAPLQWLNNHSTSETGVFRFPFVSVESSLLLSGGMESYLLSRRHGTHKLANCQL